MKNLETIARNLSYSEALRTVKANSEIEWCFVARPRSVSALLPNEHEQWLVCAGLPTDFIAETEAAQVQVCMWFNYGKRAN